MTESLFEVVPGNWLVTTLGELCSLGGGSIQTGPFGSQLHAADYVPVGTPSIMPQNIGENRIVPEGIARISEADLTRLKRHVVHEGDIVYSRRGDVERRALVRGTEDGWLCGTGCLRVRLGSGLAVPEFIAYYLGHPLVRAWVVRHAVGATMLNLSTSILSALPVIVPPLPEQQAIARILGCLDDKIELNRKMNETLEAMARALFKSWFVDFDPVRAKAEGLSAGQVDRRPYGMDDATAALFPASFEYSDLGEIPKGWQVVGILDIADLLSGGTPSTSVAEYWNGDIPWVSAKDVTKGGGSYLLETERTISEKGLKNSSTRMLPKNTTLITARGTVGNYCLLGRDMTMNQTNYGLQAKEGVGDLFVFFSVGNIIERLKQFSYGTIFDTITTKTFSDMKVVLPPVGLIRSFESSVQALMKMVLTNMEQSTSIVSIRDSLLPKLLSGEIRVDLRANEA